MPDTPRPVMLVILDGWGWREDPADNAVAQANTPTFDRLWARGPRAFLDTSGLDVGLPRGQMGNSEVGHTNIGAGRVVMQELPRIGLAIEDGSLARNPALLELIEALKRTGGTCHLMGLVSLGWMWLKMAAASHRALDGGTDDRAFHEAKLITARFYAQRELPLSTALRKKIEAGAETLMRIPAEVF